MQSSKMDKRCLIYTLPRERESKGQVIIQKFEKAAQDVRVIAHHSGVLRKPPISMRHLFHSTRRMEVVGAVNGTLSGSAAPKLTHGLIQLL